MAPENLLTAHDADLAAEITDAERRLREAAAAPYEPGKADETLATIERAAEKLRPAKAELVRVDLLMAVAERCVSLLKADEGVWARLAAVAFPA